MFLASSNEHLLTCIGFNNLLILRYFFRCTLGDNFAEVKYNHPVHYLHQLTELVFYDKHSRTFTMEPAKSSAFVQSFHRFCYKLCFCWIQPAERLIEDKHL